MKKVPFTPLEMNLLRSNPNTYALGGFSIRFTAQFKISLVRRYQAGESVKEIVESCGYDLNMLGSDCIYSLLSRTQKALAQGIELTDGCRSNSEKPQDINASFLSKDKEIATIQHELTYLRQEMEFIKKTLILESTKKRRK